MREANILICGGGIIGLTIARELIHRGYDGIVVVEKETSLGKHASGRNSGVLHAGIYYSSENFGAKFSIEGNYLLKEYCKKNNLPLVESGKVIVTKNEEEIPVLKMLYERALKNGAPVEIIDEKRLKEIEPFAKTCQIALYSPATAVIDPCSILFNLEKEIQESRKGCILKGCKFTGIKGSKNAVTEAGEIKFNFFINAAGAYSDKIAHMFSLGKKYTILPFKGTYMKLDEKKTHLVKGNIYPVPDLENPFLGVHLTKSVDGTVYAGPTAIPAFGRENYGVLSGIGFEGVKIALMDFLLFFTNREFRKTALTELRKYIKRYFFNDVEKLVEGVGIEDLKPSKKVGIRPQIVDIEQKKLVTDYLILKESESIHILNSISPAFTCAMPFAKYVVDMIESKSWAFHNNS